MVESFRSRMRDAFGRKYQKGGEKARVFPAGRPGKMIKDY
jgi:hypothetical protein